MTHADSSRRDGSQRQTAVGSRGSQKKYPVSADSAVTGTISDVMHATFLTHKVVAHRYPVPLCLPYPLHLDDGTPRNHLMNALMRMLLLGKEQPEIVHVSKTRLAELKRLLRAYSFVIPQDIVIPYLDTHYRQIPIRVIVTNAYSPMAGSSDASLFSDRVGDTLWACLMLALSQRGHRHPTDPIPFSVEEVLTMSGRRQSGGGYLSEQVHTAMSDLHVLRGITIEFLLPQRLEGLKVTYTGRLLNVGDESWGDYDLTTDATLWQRDCFQFGGWIRLLPSLSETMVALMQQVLKYHPQHDRVAKRLGRYLLWEFAATQDLSRGSKIASSYAPSTPKTDVAVDITMGELLDASAVTQDQDQPLRSKKMIDAALAQLQRDQVIGAIEQLPARDQEMAESMRLVDQQAYGWWAHYRRVRWRISCPTRC